MIGHRPTSGRHAGTVTAAGAGRRSRLSLVALLSVAAVLAAACGGGGGGSSAASGAPSASAGAPKAGGTLTFGEFSPPVGLDPIVMTGAGVTGFIETTAIYDTLMRYDYDSGKYVGVTAESATPNADNTVWTIKLRPGITFTDGTPYDADAVVFGLNRFRSGLPGAPPCEQTVSCPQNSTSSSSYVQLVKDITAVDPLTVQVTLSKPWASFQVALSAEAGMIPSPTALKKACAPSTPVSQCSFNTAPVGAGPFMITSFKPGEAITMTRNPNYWGGQVYLDGLRFISQGDGGGQKTLDALDAKTMQAAFLRDPVAVSKAHDEHLDGHTWALYGASMLLLNMAVPTKATYNPTVRQAVAAAIDPKVINQRAYQGTANATSELLTSDFRWYPGDRSVGYDPDKAKQLVAQAKAQGWNGQIGVLGSNVPTQVNEGLAIQAMLESAGMTVNLDTSKDTAASVGLLLKKDFDIYIGGLSASNDDTTYMALAQNFLSTAPSNRVGIKDPKIDAIFDQLFAAQTDDEKKAAYGAMEDQLNAQMPMVSVAALQAFVAWQPNVHGIVANVRTSVRLDKAWIG